MNATNTSGALVDRTLTNLRNAWREMTDSARVALTGAVRADLPPEDSERIERQITACLEGRGGEVLAGRAPPIWGAHICRSMPAGESAL